MKSKDYKALIDYAKKNNIRYACINEFKEIDACFEFNNLPLIDTETFEIPCCFAVERALVLCIPTPADMTPEDTGESYQTYYDYVDQLRTICRPQYIALQGAYVKIMLWCDWSESYTICDDLIGCSNEAIESVTKNIKDAVLDFRVFNTTEPTPDIYAANIDDINKMWCDYYDGNEFDCEMFINIDGCAFPTDHGVKAENYHGMLLIESY